MSPTGHTRLAAVIGAPVRHSLSPVLHNAAFTALGLDWVYVALDVAPGSAAAALDAMRTLGIGGLSVTMPHKTDVAAACDETTPDAAALRSVNCVTPLADGRLRGDSTDGEGFVRSLRDAEVDPAGSDVVLLGAGGAARAVALALGRRGARVAVAARRPEAAAEVATLHPAVRAIDWAERDDAVRAADVLVNSTPIGMLGDTELPCSPDALRSDAVVADLVYQPLQTPLLVRAAEIGARAVDGFGMLVHQAAIAFEHWTGQAPPVEVMRAAGLAALAR